MKWTNLTDSHCHIDQLTLADWKATYQRAKDAGVHQMVCVSTDEDSFRRTNLLTANHEGCLVSLGTHPHEASTYRVDDWERMFQKETYCAVGECGLDYYYLHSPKEIQIGVFRHQLSMAVLHQKPVIVHIRDAFDEAFALIKDVTNHGVSGVVHCFTGNATQVKDILDLGWYVGFTGIITFGKNADPIRDALKLCPMDRLLIETDAPYLAPAPHRGEPNEPAFLPMIAEHAASLKGLALEELIQATTENAKKLFG